MLYGSWKIPKAALSAPIIKHSQINKGGNTMANVTFNEDLCKGCGRCVDACPKKILRLSPERINVKGHHPAEMTDQEKCIACAFCATMCPDCVITVEK